MKPISRRQVLKGMALGAGLAAMPSPLADWLGSRRAWASGGGRGRKLLILGIDGLDPRLLTQYMDEGILPNFRRFASEGDFCPMRTTMPPQSPVAWSSFITGMDPGGHGIFDFVHRDPKTMAPYFSMSRTEAARRRIDVGSWVVPLSSGKAIQLRKGRAFWQILEDHGIPTMIVRMPANFPPVFSKGKSLSGMGTPDLVGTMGGQFSFFTTRLPDDASEFSGGKAYKVEVRDRRVDAELTGPANSFRRVEKKSLIKRRDKKPEYENPPLKAPFTVDLDPSEPIAKFSVGDTEFILKEGEWSDAVRVEFTAVPGAVHVSAVAWFHLQQVRPEFKLYVSPLQIDPEDPAMPISTPPGWSKEIARETGPYHTQGLPADTKALTHGVLSGGEFWDLTQSLYREHLRLLDYSLKRFREGLLFFYFSTIDESSHMLWRYVDEKHPGYVADPALHDGIRALYVQMDETLGDVMKRIDGQTDVMVMSDHGFSPFYRGMNLNTWLVEKGYAALRYPDRRDDSLWKNVDWDRTQVYAAGLNGVYVNLKGRELNGIVSPGAEYDGLLARFKADLLAARDETNGQPPVSRIALTHDEFSPAHLDIGPDAVVGYHWGYRSSWESPLGEFPRDVYVDNLNAWSADHCMDPDAVPASLLTTGKIAVESPSLWDLTVGVLNLFGIEKLPEMTGENCLKVG
ncbi:alkaline phosphatase family protein [Candidatus Sumerlaeota bacterium]|nr:alkaline phosphatase family protein [Candidatus Sumerlaeota bacterium]